LDQASNKLKAKNESRRFSVLTSSKQELTMDRRILLKGLSAGAVSIGFYPSAWSVSVLTPSKSPVPVTSPRNRTTKIIGVGGAGCNFIQSFRLSIDQHKLTNVTELVCVDLGMQGLSSVDTLYETAAGSLLLKTISLAPYGAGGRVNAARAAALRNIGVINAAVSGAGTVILVAGLGGGTGGGVLPIIARAARNAGVVTVAAVVMPFDFEGPRNGKAVTALTYLVREVDFVMPFSNQDLGDSMGNDALLADIYAQQDRRIMASLQRISLG
jgi:cell division protein FtsZ